MSKMNPTIRAYRPSDFESCLLVFRSNSPEYFHPKEEQEFINWLEGEQINNYLVVESEEQIIACGGIYENEDQKEVGLAWGMVSPRYQGKRIGSELLKRRLNLMNGYPDDFKKVCRTSQKTVGFFKRFGFKTYNYIKDGWGAGLDKIEMSL